jgi:radical SAM superfamily enzyme YgiQ (UPF0313 family)
VAFQNTFLAEHLFFDSLSKPFQANYNQQNFAKIQGAVCMSPDDSLKCLIVQPRFSSHNFWNYVEVAESIGAKTIQPPLGLLTVAALLPAQWSISLVDLNVREITQQEWDEADIICTGGMLPQQPSTLEVIARANQTNKYVVAGGPDPSSQVDVYADADAVVLGEGENAIPIWLDSWRAGEPNGVFEADARPDVTTSPVPRFDLIDFSDYVNPGVQYSRGCPFNCEFCDIIELYGRIPRSKTTEQILAELDLLYKLGYRGQVDMVDDNFIGNKRQVKPMLEALAIWSEERKYPFYFSTEATMNLADDEKLMALMRKADFRFIFMGIETPDPELLAVTQKRVNSMKPILERVNKIYEYGMIVTAGFILGFDNEKPGIGDVMGDCIEETGISIAMVGLLVALPNTQLTRRLRKEGRLISPDLELFTDPDKPYRLQTAGTHSEYKDQAAGLNFVTTRDRVEIYRDYQRLLERIYSPKNYMNRVLLSTSKLKLRTGHNPSQWWEIKRNLRGFFKMATWMTFNRSVCWYYWRNTFRMLFMGSRKFDVGQSLMSIYMHFAKQSVNVREELNASIDYCVNEASFPRMVQRESQVEIAATSGSAEGVGKATA